MNGRFIRFLLLIACVLLVPLRCPAPLVYTPGEGWTYEPVGGEGKWQRARAKDQLDVAQVAFDKKDYGLALKAARRVVRMWPLSDYAAPAQYLVGRCYEAKRDDQRAFSEYQKILEKYPRSDNVKDVLQRQYEIANRFLGGQWFKLLGYIPFFPSMDKTAGMFTKIVASGPYGDIAPQAQLKIGSAREKQSHYPEAVKAYELAADRYHDRSPIASEALFKAGLAYEHEASTAEYDQSTAGQAIATLTDFMTLYPDDSRVPSAQQVITKLKSEQARGSFEIARFYEKSRKWQGALVYYNEVLLEDPNSPYATEARERLDTIKKRTQTASK